MLLRLFGIWLSRPLGVAGITFAALSGTWAQSTSITDINKLQASVDAVRATYRLVDANGKDDLHKTLVDNYGRGNTDLRGVRNFRAVLPGFVYRGGGNNVYRTLYGEKELSNNNPLPPEALVNLCKEGFGLAIYMYPTNFGAAPKSTSCITKSGSANKLDYIQLSSLDASHANAKMIEIMNSIMTRLGSGDFRAIYIHCWNGWHASGFASAIILRQFCGFSGESAGDYWVLNTDRHPAGNKAMRRRIAKFPLEPSRELPTAVAAVVCPRI